jgi:hypothetical protein
MLSISASNLSGLKCQADFAASMAHLQLKKWLDLHRRLFLLHEDCITWFYASMPLLLQVQAKSRVLERSDKSAAGHEEGRESAEVGEEGEEAPSVPRAGGWVIFNAQYPYKELELTFG